MIAAISTRQWALIGVLAALCLVFGTMTTVADDEIAASGNGGTADCAANGGALAAGDINSGENSGSAIGVGDTWGSVDVSGGASANSTALDASLDGGTGICDASGADENIAFTLDPVPPAPAPEPPVLEPTPTPPPPPTVEPTVPSTT